MQTQTRIFDSIAQRAAYSYLRVLAAEPAGEDPSRRDLHAFFKSLYTALYENPAQFGLALEPDDYITGEETGRTKKMADLNRKLQKTRGQIDAALDFLMQVGQRGQLVSAADEHVMLLDGEEYQALLKSVKLKKPFLGALAALGLAAKPEGACVALRAARFPAMFAALKLLAPACAAREDARLGRFLFARCDFQALDPFYHPDALDLYRAFPPDDYARVARLHAYFTSKGYKPSVEVACAFDWIVKYQGNRQVKASPLMSIQYSERFQNPLRVQIKCASSARVAPLLAAAPRSLQADFFARAIVCGDCGWCRNKKSHGPSVIAFDGEQKRVCWWVPGDVKVFDDDAITLIEQYEVMHESLA